MTTASPSEARHRSADIPAARASDEAEKTANTHGASTPPEQRGSLTIADRVVERMAATIASEVEQVGGAARRVLGVTAGREDADKAPRVTAQIRGHACSLRVRLSVCYPHPVGEVTERVRRQLVDRIATLAGLQVRTVDITITALHPQSTARREIQ